MVKKRVETVVLLSRK